MSGLGQGRGALEVDGRVAPLLSAEEVSLLGWRLLGRLGGWLVLLGPLLVLLWLMASLRLLKVLIRSLRALVVSGLVVLVLGGL